MQLPQQASHEDSPATTMLRSLTQRAVSLPALGFGRQALDQGHHGTQVSS